MTEVYQICSRIRGIGFQLGYAEDVYFDGCVFHLERPFTRNALATSDWGWVCCRGTWSLPLVLSPDEYSISTIPLQGWMWVEFVDLVAAQQLCQECQVSLPIDGFSRYQ